MIQIKKTLFKEIRRIILSDIDFMNSFTWQAQQFLCTSNSYLKGPEKQTQQLSGSSHLKKRQREQNERTKDKSRSKKNTATTIRSYPQHPLINQAPDLSHPPIICNNNAMGIEFLAQLRQSSKCESVRNDEIFNLHLGCGVGPRVSIPCLLQETSHIYWFHPPKQFTRKSKEPIKKTQLPYV